MEISIFHNFHCIPTVVPCHNTKYRYIFLSASLADERNCVVDSFSQHTFFSKKILCCENGVTTQFLLSANEVDDKAALHSNTIQ